MHRILASQSDLKAACDTIEAYQAELENDLGDLSANLDMEIEALQLQVKNDRVIIQQYFSCDDVLTSLHSMYLVSTINSFIATISN